MARNILSTKQKNNGVKKNYFFFLINDLFLILIPIVTTPYISRVLGKVGIGQYSFLYSITSYFILFASLGFVTYAKREIARQQNNKHEQTIIFWEIFFARLFSVIISLILFFLLIVFGNFDSSEKTLLSILSINIIAVAFDLTYLFQGIEKFGILTVKNILIKILGLTLIFIFVKNETDLWLYTFLYSVITIVANISLWPNLPKFIEKVNFRELNIKRHIMPTIKLFIPTIATSIYTILDRTLIGILVPQTVVEIASDGSQTIQNMADIEVAYYVQSEKIVKLVITVITAMGAVMIQRNSFIISNGKFDTFRKNIHLAINFVMFLGVPIMFGLSAIASNFSPWFFGPGYDKVPMLIMILSPLAIIIGLSNVLGIQYLLPLKMDNKYTFSVTFGAIVNLVLNLFLITFYWSIGACIATISAELSITLVMLYFARKDVSLKNILFNNWKYLISGLIMFICVYWVQSFLAPSILNTFLLILEGILIYFICLLILRDKFLFLIINSFLSKVKKKSIK